MPNPDIDRELCLALNLWEEGQRCVECPDISAEKHAELYAKFGAGHDIPPPKLDTDSGFVLLLGALLTYLEKPTVCSRPQSITFVRGKCLITNGYDNCVGHGPDEKVALRAAAHALLCPKEKSA